LPVNERIRRGKRRRWWPIGAVAWSGLAALLGCAVMARLWPVGLGRTLPSPAWTLDWLASMTANLALHISIAASVFLLMLLVCRRWGLLLASTALVALFAWPFAMTFLPTSSRVASGGTLRVGTVNVLGSNTRFDAMTNELRSMRADVWGVQECTAAWADAIEREHCDEQASFDRVAWPGGGGIALWASAELQAPAIAALDVGEAGLPFVRAELELDGRPIALYVIHVLPPLRLSEFLRREATFDALLKHLAAERLPSVVVGDLNATVGAPRCRRMRSLGYRDAASMAGLGLQSTWSAGAHPRYGGALGLLPGLRLDRIWISDELTAISVEIGEGPGSDHRPVLAQLGWAAGS
ncbi:MAG: endonuclease/exonuclease/phosphatase family protein, partial [Planctomycetota bacterium]